MKLVSVKTEAPKELVLKAIEDDEVTNQNVKFQKLSGKPRMRLKRKGNKIRVKCELVRPSGHKRDNGFIFGTAFYGKIKEKNGITKISGLITTELIFHFIFTVMLGVFIAQCIVMKGFSVIPVCLVIVDLFMFKEEFRKQGIIKRFILRAVNRAEIEAEQNADIVE